MSDKCIDRKETLAAVDKLMIAAPCNVDWETMLGTGSVKVCRHCNLNVYNTSLMTRQEVADLLSADGPLPCVQLYRRHDGTLVTENCPIGLRRVRNLGRKLSRLAANIWATSVAALSTYLPLACLAQNSPADALSTPSTALTNLVEQEKPRDNLKDVKPSANQIAARAFQSAKNAEQNNDFTRAASFYRTTVSEINNGKHDPAFEREVVLSYVAFLRKNKQLDEAKIVYQGWQSRNVYGNRPLKSAAPPQQLGFAVGGGAMLSRRNFKPSLKENE